MSLFETLKQTFIQAKDVERDVSKKTFYGVFLGELQTEAGRGTEITDAVVQATAQKMQKSLQQIKTADSERELEYLKPFLPQLLSFEETVKIAQEYHANGAKELKDFMAKFNQDYRGKVDNAVVKTVVMECILKPI